MTAIDQSMGSGRRGYGAASGRKSLEFFGLSESLQAASDWLLVRHLVHTYVFLQWHCTSFSMASANLNVVVEGASTHSQAAKTLSILLAVSCGAQK
ncbi:hypothetical protein TNCV_3538891 [Trichonephila clavipes]|nr:hypothetical protein TNCV_3538891 [Trichonephila clavipes]